jgi:hypothetical protein
LPDVEEGVERHEAAHVRGPFAHRRAEQRAAAGVRGEADAIRIDAE